MDVKRIIDINCDLGEGMPNDAELMPYISSCNIACGGHFGNKETIRTAIRLARKHGVKVGAHPSYPDKEHFGRKSLDITQSALKNSLKSQITDFVLVCREEGVNINHIKLHGALYNDTAKNEELTNLVFEVYSDLKLNVPFYVSSNSILTEFTNHFIPEAFIDRRYQNDGNLVSRSHPDALIEDSNGAWEQLHQLFFDKELRTIEGQIIPMDAQTYCIHGDTQNALKILQFIHERLTSLNIKLDKNG